MSDFLKSAELTCGVEDNSYYHAIISTSTINIILHTPLFLCSLADFILLSRLNLLTKEAATVGPEGPALISAVQPY